MSTRPERPSEEYYRALDREDDPPMSTQPENRTGTAIMGDLERERRAHGLTQSDLARAERERNEARRREEKLRETLREICGIAETDSSQQALDDIASLAVEALYPSDTSAEYSAGSASGT